MSCKKLKNKKKMQVLPEQFEIKLLFERLKFLIVAMGEIFWLELTGEDCKCNLQPDLCYAAYC